MNKDERIEREYSRISRHFQDLPEKKRDVVFPLIQNAAFMAVTLQDLQSQIAAEGPVEIYTNGANQSGKKQSAAVQAYNSMVKNYATIIKTLTSMLPTMARQAFPSWKKPEPAEEESEGRVKYECETFQEWQKRQERIAAGLEQETS